MRDDLPPPSKERRAKFLKAQKASWEAAHSPKAVKKQAARRTHRPTPGLFFRYPIDIIKAADADWIIKATFKRPRTPLLTGAEAAKAINSGISIALGYAGLSLESHPSKQRDWAGKLASALRKALTLLSPSVTATKPPSPNDLAANMARLFNAAGRLPPEIADTLERHGLLTAALEDHGLADRKGAVSAPRHHRTPSNCS